VSQLAASYIVQARIAAEHANAASPEETRWNRIVGHYDLLLRLVPSPSARLARAVAVAEASGPESGLAELDGIEIPRQPPGRRRTGQPLASHGNAAAAGAAYDEAIAAFRNDSEWAHLLERQQALPSVSRP